MRRKDREVTLREDIVKILENAMVLRLGLFDEGYPYVVPLHYGYEYAADGTLVFYMHCAGEGHKLDLIRKNPHVCAEVEGEMKIVSGGDVPCKYGATFASIIARGNAEIIEDKEEKIHALSLLMKHQTGREFRMDERMASSVAVIKVSAEQVTAKARVK